MHEMTPQGRFRVFLVVVRSDQSRHLTLGRRFEVYSNSLTLGNGPDSDIPLVLPVEEACSFTITYKDISWQVVDSSSYGYLKVNGVSVTKMRITDGDIIQFHDYAFEFSSSRGIKFEFFEENERARQEDILTRAYNRGYLMSVLEWDINRHNQKTPNRRSDSIQFVPMSLVFIDVDHFGEFNKKYDHQVGDEVLKLLVQKMKSCLRSTDVVARYGGEEFCLYLPNVKKIEALLLANEICKHIASTPFIIQDLQLSITISLGVAQYIDGMDVYEFLRTANQHMLQAKKNGRNQVVG